ncbi:bidirectional sugar transporter SWEET16-like [Tripterygium wilfordii]|uniref:Bidirectional sugar transporter SWEET n=1 Tax=Tripterygium wilfordii TaxID=458696 RepID=A0A7J7D0X8_TRIWF|nr:bidirectional sugar transporter SWEET16-like [Tripterygium wilfordii]KAF5739889.1 bidirectional sugar transporter SWEET16-like [Tripterygium wilfordii]
MAALSLSFIIGVIGNIISLLVFTSPIKTFWQVVKKKSTENYRGVPYITTLLSTCLWSFYGILKPKDGVLIVTINGAGAVLQLIYVTLFLVYAPRDKKIKTAKLVGILNIGFLGAVIAVALLAIHNFYIRMTFVGVVCCGLTIGMYASPLSVMRTVMVTKSVKYMPFFLSFFLFLNGGVWSIYAVLVRDIYLGVPNAIGFVFGSAQLILYTVYKNKSRKPAEEDEDVDSVHLVNVEKLVIEDDEEANMSKNRRLSKGKSLPKPSFTRQYSLQKLVKTLSMNKYELHSVWANQDDLEIGHTPQ